MCVSVIFAYDSVFFFLTKLCREKPSLLTLFEVEREATPITYSAIVKLLKPGFSDEGSNRKIQEKAIYRVFLDYLKEVAGLITLISIQKIID